MAYYRGGRDREEQIREITERRRRDSVSIRGVPSVEAGAVVTPAELVPALEIRGPWQRDQVTLSLEAQVILLEQRASAKLGLADLSYVNTITSMEIKRGIYIRVEPTGCYRLSWRR